MDIRPAKNCEAALLTEIAFTAKAHWGYSVDTLQSWQSSLTISAASIDADPTFVADLDGGLCGFYQLSVDADRWELEHFWIAPKFMRRGIGQKLLAHAREKVRSHGAAELFIDADPNAEGFYRACGAKTIGHVAAPIAEDPNRVRPLLVLTLD